MSQAIIVCTRDRPDDLRRCLASVLATRLPGTPVVVVDQSRADDTEEIVRALSIHENIDYRRTNRTGAATARNDGAVGVDEDLLLFVDDDCEVDPDWAAAWAAFFECNPSVGLGFGRVDAPPFDAAAGIIPTFEPGPADRVLGPEILRRGPIDLGMSANMAVRRTAWDAASGLDEHLGAGTAFPAAEETDLAVRLLDLHFDIAHAPGPRVLHHGFRRAEAAPKLFRGYWVGAGAMYGKHIRSGDRRAIGWAVRGLWTLSTETVRKALTGVRPTGFNAARSLVKGLVMSTRQPVDRTVRMYLPRRELTSYPVSSAQYSGE